MEPSNSPRRTPVPGRGRASVVARYAIALLMFVAAVVLPAAPGVADKEDSDDDKPSLEELNERADQLAQQYQGRLAILDGAQRDAKGAASRTQRLKEKQAKLRKQVGRVAAVRYMGSGLPPAATALSGNPQKVLDRAATLDYLASQKSRQLRKLHRLQERSSQAKQQAQDQVEELESKIEKLEQRKEEVQQLIAKYKREAAINSGGSASGCSGNITSRMCTVRNKVIQKFGSNPTVGCYRPGSFGEHPKGRACDFMLSTGGQMPSASQRQRGDAMAQWAIDHASELGIMYIIYRQRIWDIRSGGGWEHMEDRGSVTANHYDHVHISVF